MKNPRPRCPNTACVNHVDPPTRFYRKCGYRLAKHNHQPVPRYQCKACGKKFCATQTKMIAWQHRPELNRRILEMAVSGTSARRMALLLGCSKRTVDQKIVHLAKEAEKAHRKRMAVMRTSFVMMDELITYIHARPKHVSVAMVVRVKTGEVLGFAVSRIPTMTKLGNKYQWNQDDMPFNIPRLLGQIAPCLKSDATIATDAAGRYPRWVKQCLPGVHHQRVNAAASKVAQSQRAPDPLFAINLTFAKMRNDLARLGRKSWITSKTIQGLENHLWLWVAWNNKYRLK